MTAVMVSATLSGATQGTATRLTVTVGGVGDSATSGTDYTAVVPFAVTIGAGMQSGTETFRLSPVDDEIVEGDERIGLSGMATGFTVTGTELTLRDDESEQDLTLTLSVSVSEIAEAVQGTAEVVARLSGGGVYATDQTIEFSVVGGTASSDDYDFAPRRATLLANRARARASTLLFARDDEEEEGDETVVIGAVNVSDGNAPVGTPQTVTIIDDDGPAVSLDINEEGGVDELDAAVLYYAYLRGVLLYPDQGGSALFRGAFLSRLVPNRSNRTDAFYLRMLEGAATLRSEEELLDLNGDGSVDELDAAVLYYAYLRGVLLYPDRGGSAQFRGAFLSRLVRDRGSRNDAFYLRMLERAKQLQDAP